MVSRAKLLSYKKCTTFRSIRSESLSTDMGRVHENQILLVIFVYPSRVSNTCQRLFKISIPNISYIQGQV